MDASETVHQACNSIKLQVSVFKQQSVQATVDMELTRKTSETSACDSQPKSGLETCRTQIQKDNSTKSQTSCGLYGISQYLQHFLHMCIVSDTLRRVSGVISYKRPSNVDLGAGGVAICTLYVYIYICRTGF